MYSGQKLLRARILPEQRSVTGGLGEGGEAQELACARKEV